MTTTGETLTVGQVARLAGVSAVTVYRRVESGRLPSPVSTDGVSRWDRREVESAISDEQVLVTTQEVMRILGVSRPTVFAMVNDQRLPQPHRRGNANYWRRVDVEDLLNARVVAVDAGAGVAVDRRGRLVQYGATALTPAGVEAPATLRAAARGPVAQLKHLLAEAVGLAEYLPDDEEADALRATLETRGVPIAAEPDPERVEWLQQQVALHNQRSDDEAALRQDERLGGVQQQYIQLYRVVEPDGATTLDFRDGEEHQAALAADLVRGMPFEDLMALVKERIGGAEVIRGPGLED